MSDDLRFAAICRWLRETGHKLRCANTARSCKQKPVLVLIDKKTNRLVGRA